MTYNVLFLCTGNSARSILGEAILNRIGGEKFRAWSAGSDPKGAVNPHTIQLLDHLGHDTSVYRSKSWDEFTLPGAPQFDFIFTVCDNAANEVCPAWPGKPMTAHWGLPDPAAATGDDVEIARAFRNAYAALERRIELFAALPFKSLDRMSLNHRLDQIGARARCRLSFGPAVDRRGAGNAFLLVAVVGSGIMAERLAGGNMAVALLANALATGAALTVLITMFAPLSGAHFNPAVSFYFALRGAFAWRSFCRLSAGAGRGRHRRRVADASDVR